MGNISFNKYHALIGLFRLPQGEGESTESTYAGQNHAKIFGKSVRLA